MTTERAEMIQKENEIRQASLQLGFIMRELIMREQPAITKTHIHECVFMLLENAQKYRCRLLDGKLVIQFSVGPKDPNFKRVATDIAKACLDLLYFQNLKLFDDQMLQNVAGYLIAAIQDGRDNRAEDKLAMVVKEAKRRGSK